MPNRNSPLEKPGLKTGSKPSIISGVVSCIILAIAYTKNLNPLALGTSAALTIVFAIRFKKTVRALFSCCVRGAFSW